MSRGDAPGEFWSRRKARVAREAEEDAREAARLRREAEEDARAARPDAEILADLDLPDPDTLGPGDDVRRFMDAAVPERLRRRALRQLWRSNPALANLDALVDYGEDYTDAARVVAELQTAYEVGRGIAGRFADAPPSAPAPKPESDGEGEPAGAAAAPETPADDAAPASATLVARDNSADGDGGDPRDIHDTEDRPPPPRRMRFAFRDMASEDRDDRRRDP